MYQQQKLISQLQQEYTRQHNLLLRLKALKPQLPDGHLSYKRGYFYRGVQVNSRRCQIPISERSPGSDALIYQLRLKRHIAKALPVLSGNCQCLSRVLKDFRLYDPVAVRNALALHYHDFDPEEILLSGDLNPETWPEQAYEHNTSFPEHLKYPSEGGILTRSKAEADIATMLERRSLSFRYEPVLHLGTQTLSPDFAVLHPSLRVVIYWEHFGMMDDPGYACRTMEKLTLYAKNGICLGSNLIMTYETKEFPLHFGHINRCIDQYFF